MRWNTGGPFRTANTFANVIGIAGFNNRAEHRLIHGRRDTLPLSQQLRAVNLKRAHASDTVRKLGVLWYHPSDQSPLIRALPPRASAAYTYACSIPASAAGPTYIESRLLAPGTGAPAVRRWKPIIGRPATQAQPDIFLGAALTIGGARTPSWFPTVLGRLTERRWNQFQRSSGAPTTAWIPDPINNMCRSRRCTGYDNQRHERSATGPSGTVRTLVRLDPAKTEINALSRTGWLICALVRFSTGAGLIWFRPTLIYACHHRGSGTAIME